MAYTNISFITEKGLPFIVEYEPILISKDVTCNIFGAKTENRFASCQRGDIKNTKIAYVTDNLETIKCGMLSRIAFLQLCFYRSRQV